MNRDKHIWEGWTVGKFVDDLEHVFEFYRDELTTKEDVKTWCASNQPYYKKNIPEVSNYFINKIGL